ncbi:hypothetical protein VSDG_03413 [Cytospora chrysosperma]|uniref:Uncharacterized protein n=1 Tax=Cytospora chrysosperma TaxID=252740 RepID=A0A423WBD2_CYTCH|nr:hypothetical protein VSDG_03413 [Valsa sordida]
MANIACAFTLREIEKLNTVLDSLVFYFSIEFLPNTLSGKPRVAFRLKTLTAEEDKYRKAGYPPTYRVCRMSMVHTRSRKGELEIELLPDVKGETEGLAAGVPAFDLSADAVAAFYFRVNHPPMKLGQWLDILEGHRRSLDGSDLTYFKFTRGIDLGGSTVLNGCRDFMRL